MQSPPWTRLIEPMGAIYWAHGPELLNWVLSTLIDITPVVSSYLFADNLYREGSVKEVVFCPNQHQFLTNPGLGRVGETIFCQNPIYVLRHPDGCCGCFLHRNWNGYRLTVCRHLRLVGLLFHRIVTGLWKHVLRCCLPWPRREAICLSALCYPFHPIWRSGLPVWLSALFPEPKR